MLFKNFWLFFFLSPDFIHRFLLNFTFYIIFLIFFTVIFSLLFLCFCPWEGRKNFLIYSDKKQGYSLYIPKIIENMKKYFCYSL